MLTGGQLMHLSTTSGLFVLLSSTLPHFHPTLIGSRRIRSLREVKEGGREEREEREGHTRLKYVKCGLRIYTCTHILSVHFVFDVSGKR